LEGFFEEGKRGGLRNRAYPDGSSRKQRDNRYFPEKPTEAIHASRVYGGKLIARAGLSTTDGVTCDRVDC